MRWRVTLTGTFGPGRFGGQPTFRFHVYVSALSQDEARRLARVACSGFDGVDTMVVESVEPWED